MKKETLPINPPSPGLPMVVETRLRERTAHGTQVRQRGKRFWHVSRPPEKPRDTPCKARKCLQNCYVLKYHWAPEQWRRSRLRTWVPELEGLATWLERLEGLGSQGGSFRICAGHHPPRVPSGESGLHKPGHGEIPLERLDFRQASTSKQFPKHPRDVLRLFDLRQDVKDMSRDSAVLTGSYCHRSSKPSCSSMNANACTCITYSAPGSSRKVERCREMALNERIQQQWQA